MTGDPDAVTARPLRRVATAYWPVAILEVVVAALVSLILPRLEVRYRWHDGLAYDASSAQATLSAIAAGMITLTGFVLTAVTLMVQTVQGQSSRLLLMLNRTERTPLLFGTFTATFTFAVLVLSRVHASSVPSISVTVALVMVLCCAAIFLRLLITFRTRLTVGGLTTIIGDDLRRLIDVRYPAPYPAEGRKPEIPRFSERRCWIIRHAGSPGVFQSFDQLAAVALAASANTDIRFVPAVGDFVVTGAALATGTGPEPDAAAVRRLVRIGPHRTLEQDPAYGLRMLADIALRALSPGVNDPTSAVEALNQVDDILHRLAGRSLGDGLLHGADGQVLVSYPAPAWEAFLALGVDEILLNGASSLQVARRLRALLEDLLNSAPEARRPPVAARLAGLRRAVLRAYPDETVAALACQPDPQGIGSPRCYRL